MFRKKVNKLFSYQNTPASRNDSSYFDRNPIVGAKFSKPNFLQHLSSNNKIKLANELIIN